MRLAVDLHIHSALSPCSDKDMTPNNIVNMALLKQLDIIAVTDHNSVENLPAVIKCAAGTELVVIPGMELETSEEVHVICLFPELAAAFEMQKLVYAALPDALNRKDIFGNQLVMDENDCIINEVERFLLTATSLSLDQTVMHVRSLGGVVIPAHVDRDSYSIISNLGFIPEEHHFKYIEISSSCVASELAARYPSLDQYQYIKSSDAHELGSILERESILELYEKSANALIRELIK